MTSAETWGLPRGCADGTPPAPADWTTRACCTAKHQRSPRLGLVAVPALHPQRLLPILVSQSGFRWPKARAQEGRTQGTTLEDGQGGGSFVRCSVRRAPAWYLSTSTGQARAASTGTCDAARVVSQRRFCAAHSSFSLCLALSNPPPPPPSFSPLCLPFTCGLVAFFPFLLFVLAFVFALTCLADAVAAASPAVDFLLLADLHLLPCCGFCLCFVTSSLSRCSFSPSLLFPTPKNTKIFVADSGISAVDTSGTRALRKASFASSLVDAPG